MANITMNAKDAVSAKLAECYVTIEGRRYLLMQGKDFEAKFEKTKKEINVLGKTGSGNKSTENDNPYNRIAVISTSAASSAVCCC